MIRHTVLMRCKIKDEIDKQMKLNTLCEMLEEMPENIIAIEDIEVGRNISSKDSAYDIALVVDFADNEALNTYRKHPEHEKVLKYMQTMELDLAFVDYMN